jgi:hypothetical protein
MEGEVGCEVSVIEEQNEISAAVEDRDVSFRDLVSNIYIYLFDFE